MPLRPQLFNLLARRAYHYRAFLPPSPTTSAKSTQLPHRHQLPQTQTHRTMASTTASSNTITTSRPAPDHQKSTSPTPALSPSSPSSAQPPAATPAAATTAAVRSAHVENLPNTTTATQESSSGADGAIPSSLKPPPALPAPGTETESSPDSQKTTTVVVNGAPISLDALGPMVVNRDGTLARIANWQEMSSFERENTLRILGKRNQLRLATLRSKDNNTPDNKG